jgi:hypothetical protein
MSHDVFISYSSKDKAIADAVCAKLENNQIRCWIAPRDILPGIEYGQALVEAIKKSRVVVLILSSNSNVSPQVMREIERAVSLAIPIIPLRIENITPSESMEYYLSSLHWLDAITPPIEQHLDKLTDSVVRILGGNVSVGDEADGILSGGTGRSAPKSNRSGWRINPLPVVLIALIGLLAVIGFVIWGKLLLAPRLTQTPISKVIETHTTAALVTKIMPTPTIMRTQTTRPTVTPSPVPSWVTDFSQPILDAIADRPPSFQDDFGLGSAGWEASRNCGQRMKYESGELVVIDCSVRRPGIDYSDFVIEFDAHILLGAADNAEWLFRFREPYIQDPGALGHSLWITYSGHVRLGLNVVWNPENSEEIGQMANPGILSNHILAIGKGPEIAIYLNDQPLFYSSNSILLFGDFGFSSYGTNLAIDNFKIWNIYDLP